MKRILSFPLFILLFSISLSAQAQTSSITRECRISAGYGFARPVHGPAVTGTAGWAQMSYPVIGHFLLAMDYAHLQYKERWYQNQPGLPRNQVIEENLSLLIKYQFPDFRKWRLTLASGWTYCPVGEERYSKDNMSQNIILANVAYSDFRVPLLAELEYPVKGSLHVQARVEYFLSGNQLPAYTAGIGLSLKL